MKPALPDDIAAMVATALAEDIGSGDLTASLVPESAMARATVTTREDMVMCGQAWFDEVYRQLDPAVRVDWAVEESATVVAGTTLCSLSGPARVLLTGERTALNFVQLLAGTATRAAAFAAAVAGTKTRVLDTRKTVPGLRSAQKYAVRCGGCDNHRHGLWDGILIKENHIAAAGGIAAAVRAARSSLGTVGAPPTRREGPNSPPSIEIEVEVESLDQLDQAITAGADIALLDNFTVEQVAEAVARAGGRILLEASGNVTLATLPALAATGVDRISTGALTKDIQTIDLSMRFVLKSNTV